MILIHLSLILAVLSVHNVYGQTSKIDFKECDSKSPEFSYNGCQQLRSETGALQRRLLKHYNVHARPVSDSRKPIYVTIGFSLIDILDVKDNSINVHGWLYLDWDDELLTWTNDYQTSIRLPKSKIWTPDIVQFNSKVTDSEDGNDEDVLLYNNGKVIRVIDKQFSAICDLDLRFFPYDKHTCNFKFGSWVLSTSELVLENRTANVETDYYRPNSQWKLLSTSVIKETQTYKTPDSYMTLLYSINIQRHGCNYFFSIILPVIILSVFALLIFLVPLQWPVLRLGFNIFIVAGLFVLLFYIQQFIAYSSTHTPLISIYLAVLLIVASIAVIFNVVLLYLNQKSGPVPDLLKKCVKCERNDETESEWKGLVRCLDITLFIVVFALVLITVFTFIMLSVLM